MNKKCYLLLICLISMLLGLNTVFAQFPKISKIPKIDKSKNDPKTDDNGSTSGQTNTSDNKNPSGNKTNKAAKVYTNIKPTAKPVFVKDSLYVQAHTREEYWKFPAQKNYSSWVPNTKFDIFYDGNAKLNLMAEYTNPDNTPWYSEKLDQGPLNEGSTASFESPRPNSDEMELKRSTTATGLYGVKITNKDSGEVIFQGKFKVNKYRAFDNPQDKNRFEFYVEHDWLLPIGYVGFEIGGSLEIGALQPSVSVWLKNNVQANELEARLFYKDQQIATTANRGGAVVDQGERSTFSSARFADQYYWKQWHFRWSKFLFDNGNAYNADNYPGALYADKNPGEYTVKIYRNGNEIRETKFTIGSDGRFVDGGYGKPGFLMNYNVIIPVKVIGTTEKWNPTAWKTDAFYANPMSGFDVQ